MNILYINNEMTIGGVTKCILKLCNDLDRDKYNIFIASNNKGALLKEFEDIGINNLDIIDVSNKLPHNIIRNIIKLKKFVVENNIDIIHSHHRMTTLLAKLVSKLVNVKVIHTQHLCIEDKYRLTGKTLKNIDVITVSDAAKRILIEKSFLNSDRIRTIYNTIEEKCENTDIDNRLLDMHTEGYFCVAQVSRAVDYKGVYDFVDIAEKVISINNKIRFFFIGDGVELANLKSYIKEKNLENYVILLGNKNNVIKHFEYIDLCLLCSYIEGLPLAPIEAFSQGVPVIATNINGTNEVVDDNVTGYLVKSKDINEFVNKIIYLERNRDKLDEFKKNSIERYNKLFNNDMYIKSHEALYEQILKK